MKNLPAPESLLHAAERSHFRAWEIIFQIIHDFKEYQEWSAETGGDEKDLRDYSVVATEEIYEVYTLAAHANELFLRGKLCEVSPYLLLVNTNNSFSRGREVDFTELRTVDAVDLPKIVEVTTNFSVSDEFVGFFNKLRSQRNKITHLGSAEISVEIMEITSLLCLQYSLLWGDDLWWHRRFLHESRSRYAYLSGDWEDAETTRVLNRLKTLKRHLSKSNFQKIFGHAKGERAWICGRCWPNSGISDYDEARGYESVYIKGKKACCIICHKDFRIKICDECGQLTPHEDSYCIPCNY